MLETDANAGMVRNLVVGVALSAAVHASVLVWSQVQSHGQVATSSDDQVAPQVTQPLKLGIDRSSAATINWIGFESPTEHSATQSTVEQAAVTPVVGTTQVASEDQPSPPAEAESSPDQVATEQPQQVLPEESVQPPSDEISKPTIAIPSALAIPMDIFEPVATAPVSSTEALLNAEPAPEVKTSLKESKPAQQAEPSESVSVPQKSSEAKPSEKPQEAKTASADPSGTQGIKDTREADASTKIPNLKWSPGKPIAGEGLDIATVRPQWSVTVKAIARPRNPVVQIHFGADGIVRRAEFLKVDGEHKGTGHPHVDGPLMDAIYRWTAKGKAIDELLKDETLTVEIQLLLRG